MAESLTNLDNRNVSGLAGVVSDVRHVGSVAVMDRLRSDTAKNTRDQDYFDSQTLNFEISAEMARLENGLYEEASNDPIVQSVEAEFVAAGDYHTLEHMRRATKFGLRLGLEMGFDRERLRIFAQAMRVHDRGKLLPKIQELIYANRLWGPKEHEENSVHPAEGRRVLAGRGMDPVGLDIVGGHHLFKRTNPYGVSDHSDRWLEMLSAVADVTDAACSERPHRHSTQIPFEAGPAVFNQELSVDDAFQAAYYRLVTPKAA